MKKNNILKQILLNFYDKKKVLYIVKQDSSNNKRVWTYLANVKGSRIESPKLINRDLAINYINKYSNDTTFIKYL